MKLVRHCLSPGGSMTDDRESGVWSARIEGLIWLLLPTIVYLLLRWLG